MNSPLTHSKHIEVGRDPVCESIESLLRRLEAEGKAKLQVTRSDGSVRVSFDGVHCDGVTYDIALLRVASELIDQAKYGQTVMDILRAPIHAAKN